MEKVVSCIEIVFENCESIVVPIHLVKKLEFENIVPYENYPFKEENVFHCEHTIVDISYQNESDLTYHDENYEYPLGMFTENPISNNVKDRPNILGRIMNFNDIVMIKLLDNKQEPIKRIYVLWHEDDEYNNRYLSKEAKEGILHIEIGKVKEEE